MEVCRYVNRQLCGLSESNSSSYFTTLKVLAVVNKYNLNYNQIICLLSPRVIVLFNSEVIKKGGYNLN